MSSTYSLHYFGGRGVAEVIRYCFSIGGITYEDKRYPITFGTPGDFSTMSRKEWDDAKASGMYTKTQNVLPALVIDGGEMIGESKAIERFVAGVCGLMGSTPVEGLAVDCACEMLRSIKDAYQKARAGDAAAKDAYFAEALPALCKKAEAALPASFATGAITLADVSWYYAFHFFWDRKEEALAATTGCPTIQAMFAKVKGNAAAMKWEADRPDTAF